MCNAAETLLVHQSAAAAFLPRLEERMPKVRLHGCARTLALTKRAVPATEEDYETEYLDYDLAVKVVDSLVHAFHRRQ